MATAPGGDDSGPREENLALSRQALVRLYRKRAKRYDLTANLYYLIGFREQAYRKKAVRALRLNRGDTVVEIGCGSGLNFPLLEKAVGPEGKIIGVDTTDAMLAKARDRVRRRGWANVQLIESDAADYPFPSNLGGIISTFAITLVPQYDRVIKDGAAALAPGRRFVVLDFKLPSKVPGILVKLGVFIMRPFGVTLDLADRHPLESLQKHFFQTSFKELYLGFAYVAAGQKAAA